MAVGEDVDKAAPAQLTTIPLASWFLVLAALLPSVALPVGIPAGFSFGGKQLFWGDALLPLAAVVAVRRLPATTARTDRWLVALVLVLAASALHGIVGKDVGFGDIIQDTRGLFYLVCGYLVSSRVGFRVTAVVLTRVAVVALPLTAAALLLGDVIGVQLLQGRQEATTAFAASGPNQTFEVTRYLIATKTFATFAVVMALALVLAGRARDTKHTAVVWAVLLTGAVISFNSYSRSTIIGLAASVAVLALYRTTAGLRSTRLAWGAVVISSLAAALIYVPFGLSDANGNLLQQQVAAFNARVVQGLEEQNLTEAPGNEWRVVEARYATAAIVGSPAFGLGLGTEYRPDNVATDEAFRSNPDYGKQFIHNAVLFLLVKLGIVGTGVLGALLATSASAALGAARRERRDPLVVGAVAGVVGVIVCSLFQPDLINLQTAGLVGLVAGALADRGHPSQA